ncbi:MAG TPA: hypothetical protein VI197_30950 [Polyangiaceae bacterium]
MNSLVLIDQVVRQTMVLIAQLATSGGTRAPLAHIADRVFLELAKELEAQGLSRKVSADMFGVALRSYRRRIQRSSESVTQRGRSLWAALLDFVPSDRLVTRGEVLAKFHLDEELQVRAILSDLCESGLVLQLGRGVGTAYRAATTEELAVLDASTDGLAQLVWVVIYREGPITSGELKRRLSSEAPRIEAALEHLLGTERISVTDGAYSTREVVVTQRESSGWEAAMLDHFQAMVKTLCGRLRGHGDPQENGGSTYSFDMSRENPMAREVYQTLTRLRSELSELRSKVEAYNSENPDEATPDLVTVYFGQFVQTADTEGSVLETDGDNHG